MNITYLANPNSPHVLQWLSLLDNKTRVRIWTIESPNVNPASQPENIEIRSIHRYVSWMPKAIRYMVLGLLLAIRPTVGSILHAHNSSGYGLSAFVSGRNYILTTYGTEIFAANKRGQLYYFLIRRILSRASAITTTSEEMQRTLIKEFDIDGNRIENFSLGVTSAFSNIPPTAERESIEQCPIWVSNRRALPLYNVDLIIEGFNRFKAKGGKGKLYILQGDAKDRTYLERLKSLAAGSRDVIFIESFLDTGRIIELLDSAHFTFSLPDTDQLSSSILEPMARGVLPIVGPLQSYKAIQKGAIFLDATNIDSIEEVFWETSLLSEDDFHMHSVAAKNEIDKQFSSDRACKKYFQILHRFE